MTRKTTQPRTPIKGGDPFRDPPTVAGVRAVRAKMLRDAGGTLEGLIELARREAAAVRTRPGGSPKRRHAA